MLQATQAGAANGLGGGFGMGGTGSTQLIQNTISKNNIYHLWKPGKSAFYQSAPSSQADHDMYNGTPGDVAMTGGINATPAYAAGNGWVSEANGQYQLAPGTPGYDAGARIPNFNDAYNGSAPDVGAHEGGSAAMKFGIAASTGAALAGSPVARYRLYSPVTREHHFTTDLNEYMTLGSQVGTWVQEGTVGKVLDNPGTFNGVTAVPYYRLYNPSSQQHHWTTDANEYAALISVGWQGEGIDGYILPRATTGTMPLYRLFLPSTGTHHWTVDANEYNTLIAAYGWIGEGIAGYVIQ
jgi:hypothetical protein